MSIAEQSSAAATPGPKRGLDILLTHAYFLNEDPHERQVMKPYPPLGLLYVSAYLKSRGFRVGVFDTTFSDPATFEANLDRERPPLVGIYCTLMTRRGALDLIRTCRDRGAVVAVGGPDPATCVDEYLASGADLVVVGEGEETLPEVIERFENGVLGNLQGVRGIAYRDADGQVVHAEPRPLIKDLDSLPFPDLESVEIQEYLRVWRTHHGAGSVSMVTARGCPYTCAWCSHSVFGYTHRRRTPENVANELEQIVERYRPDAIWYADDVFTINRAWLFRYAAELERRGLRVPFEAISREDRLNDEVVRKLADMGCARIWLGAESGSQRVLDAMDRRISATRTQEMSRLLQRHGIQVGMFVMLGYEGEEIEDIKATVEHLKAAAPDQFLTTVAYPIRGTPYHRAVEDRIVAPAPWGEGSDRDVHVLGRHSRRFYRFATRWMVSEVNWHKQRSSGQRAYARMARAFASAQVGRIGMLLTRHEVERGPARS